MIPIALYDCVASTDSRLKDSSPDSALAYITLGPFTRLDSPLALSHFTSHTKLVFHRIIVVERGPSGYLSPDRRNAQKGSSLCQRGDLIESAVQVEDHFVPSHSLSLAVGSEMLGSGCLPSRRQGGEPGGACAV